MNPEPLASRGACCWSPKKSSNVRGRCCRCGCRLVWRCVRSEWIETTDGVTRSAMDENAILRSVTEAGTIGATDVAAAGRVDDCAYPNLVRSRPEANSKPLTNAATTAPPKVMRAIGFFMFSFSSKGPKLLRPNSIRLLDAWRSHLFIPDCLHK